MNKHEIQCLVVGDMVVWLEPRNEASGKVIANDGRRIVIQWDDGIVSDLPYSNLDLKYLKLRLS